MTFHSQGSLKHCWLSVLWLPHIKSQLSGLRLSSASAAHAAGACVLTILLRSLDFLLSQCVSFSDYSPLEHMWPSFFLVSQGMHQGLWIYCCPQKGVLCTQPLGPLCAGWRTRMTIDTFELPQPNPMLDIVRRRCLGLHAFILVRETSPLPPASSHWRQNCAFWRTSCFTWRLRLTHLPERIGVVLEGVWHVTCFVQGLCAPGHLYHHCRHYCGWAPL